MSIQQTTGEATALKLVTLWGAVGFANWSEVQAFFGAIAAILASIYSIILIYKALRKPKD